MTWPILIQAWLFCLCFLSYFSLPLPILLFPSCSPGEGAEFVSKPDPSLSFFASKMAGVWRTAMADGFGRLLTSEELKGPLSSGEVFEFSSIFDDGESSESVVAVVLKEGPEGRSYWVEPLFVQDPYYRWHLCERDGANKRVLVQLACRQRDMTKIKLDGIEVEMVTAYRSLGIPGADLDFGVVDWLTDDEIIKLVKGVAFVREMISVDSLRLKVQTPLIP
jgi:hypothetical protein